jgi:DNA processing protein
MRNRTMALICQASVIVEASDGSGTLSQGWEALRLGRPLFIAEEIVDNKSLTWPAEMLDYGARILGQDADDLLEILPPPGNLDIIQHAF